MLRQFIPALRMVVLLTVLTGIAYPLLITLLCQGLFPRQANGSLIARNGQVIGSELIGQEAGSPKYFHARPSAAGNGYDGLSSSPSNLGPTNQKLTDRVRADIQRFRAENPEFTGPIPSDLLMSSGSGLDPDISPASAYAQAARIAAQRHTPKAAIEQLIAAQIQPPTLGILGEPRVNVLTLNLALDELHR
jgi:potassium-transporting ATPase KdpC subunit